MKKILMFTVLAGFLSACTIENEPVEINDAAIQTEDLECVPDVSNPPPILGGEYVRTNFVIQTPVDGNGDGVFSTELFNEGLCVGDPLRFRTDFTVWNVKASFVSLKVDQNNEQKILCSEADASLPIYIQTGNNIDFCHAGNIIYTGTLSNNDNTLTITLPYDQLLGFTAADGGNEILMADGTIENYEGNAVITYTRL